MARLRRLVCASDFSTASDEIVREARSPRADMIIIGTHGRRGLARVFLGSVADRVVRMALAPSSQWRGR